MNQQLTNLRRHPALTLTAALLLAATFGCAGGGGEPFMEQPCTDEMSLNECLVFRSSQYELDTEREHPPRGFLDPDVFIEHEASGFAKVLCSAVFLTGLDFEAAQHQIGGFTSRYQYRDRLPGREVDMEGQKVHITTDTGVTRTAVLHGDQGCVTLPIGEEAPFYETVPVTSTVNQDDPWPMGDVLPDEPLPEDVDAEKLEAAVDAAFEEGAMTLAFVVLHRGRLVAERYREEDGITKDTPLESWSMNKSLSATLMGVLIEQGEYTLDQLAPVDSWHEDPDDVRGTIRIQDILRMSSGLRCVNAGDPEYDEAAMGYPDHLYLYTGTVNSHLWATERPPQWPPNTIGRYRNCDPILTNHLVRLAVEGRGENYHQFPQKHLFDRIGVRRFVAEADPYGNFLLNGYGFGSGRTWARLGQLYLDDGVSPTGERVLPEGFVEFVSTPAPAWVADGRPIYGAFFWINQPPRGGQRRYPSLPESAFSMQGAGGQSTIIVPSHEMVVVRLGLYEGSFGGHADAALQEALALLVAAIPEE
jgi:CubicO group peptidase (beta-lactamase class C family)